MADTMVAGVCTKALYGAPTFALMRPLESLPNTAAVPLAYDIDGYMIPEHAEAASVGDRNKLVANADGSLDLCIQADSPGKEKEKEANWLPVGKARFTQLMRLYSPREEFLEGQWVPCGSNRVSEDAEPCMASNVHVIDCVGVPLRTGGMP